MFIICSNSGGNGSTVELARLVTERGHPLIAVTSMDHTTKITSRHPSGKRLFELADVVIDNGGAFGDAVLDLPDAPDGSPQGTDPRHLDGDQCADRPDDGDRGLRPAGRGRSARSRC